MALGGSVKVLRTFRTLDEAFEHAKYLRSVRGDRYSVHDYSVHDHENPWAVSELTPEPTTLQPAFESAYVLFQMWLADAVSRMDDYP
jgi:hypothetical protein